MPFDASRGIRMRAKTTFEADGTRTVTDSHGVLPALRLRPYGAMFDVHTARLHVDMRLLQKHWPAQFAKVKDDVRQWFEDMIGDRDNVPLQERLMWPDDPVYGRGADLGPYTPRPIPSGWRLRRAAARGAGGARARAKLVELLSSDGVPHIEVMEWWDVSSSPPSWQPRTPDGVRHRWNEERQAYMCVDGDDASPGDAFVFQAPARAAAPARTASGDSEETACTQMTIDAT